MGDKCTIADLVFPIWNDKLGSALVILPEQDKFKRFPNVKAWHKEMVSKSSWEEAMDTREKLMDEQGLMWNGTLKGVSYMAEFEENIRRDEEAKRQEKQTGN